MKQLTNNPDTIAYVVTAIVLCFPIIPMLLLFPYSDYRTPIGHLIGDVCLWSIILCWLVFPFLAMLFALIMSFTEK